MVATVVLSLISASVNGGALMPGPHGKDQEREGQRPRRESRAQEVADRHCDPVHQERGHRHPGQHHPETEQRGREHLDRFAGRAIRQYADSTIWRYSPSLTIPG
jgi:hypothetical protein